MGVSGDLVRRLLAAYAAGDSAAFARTARQLVEEERRKNHHVLARELERLISSGPENDQGKSLKVFRPSSDVPYDQDRGLPLVQVINPTRSLESLVLSDRTRAHLVSIVEENRKGEILRSFGLRPVQRALFYGPPGCGKTLAAEAIARELHLPLVIARFDSIISSYLGETAANLRKVLTYAQSPIVLLFDEFDAIGKRRSLTDEHAELRRTVNAFLQILDSYRGESIILAATNQEALLDEAIWRRFDDVVEFPLPSHFEKVLLLKLYLRQIELEPRINLGDIAESLAGASHADVEAVANQAIKHTILSSRNVITTQALSLSVEGFRDRKLKGTTSASGQARGRGRKHA